MTIPVRNIQPGCEDIADIYVRVSTGEQDTDGKTSIPDQIAYVRENLSRLGFREGRVWQEVHSASTRHRPQLNAAMARVRRGEVGALIVAKADRFIRNPIGLMVLMEDIKALNVGLIACLERIDSRDPWGVRIWQSMIESAEMYRMNMFDNTMNAKLSNAKKGLLPTAAGNGIVFGYIYHHATKDTPGWFEIDPVTAPWVVKMFRWSHEGLSNYAIAAKMRQSGTPAPGSRRKRKPGQPEPEWHATAVGRILQNRAYLGEYEAFRDRPDPSVLRNFPMSRWQEHWKNPDAKPLPCPDVFPAILDTPELAVLAEGYEGRAEQRQRLSPRNSRRDYFLRGTLRCERCGHIYSGFTQERRNGDKTYTYRYYACCNNRCPNNACLRMDETDAEAWQHVVNLMATPDSLDTIIAASRSDTRGQEVEADIDRLTRAIASVEGDISRNLDLIESGTLRPVELKDRRAKREKLLEQYDALVGELEAAQCDRGRLSVSDDLERAVRAAAGAIRDDLLTLTDPTLKRQVLDGLQADFVVTHVGKKRSVLQLRIGGRAAGDVLPITIHPS